MAQASLHCFHFYTTYQEHGDGDDTAMLSSTGARTDNIPVVDFDSLVNGAADQRSSAVRELGRACEEWGFFMVINHGVLKTVRESMMEACKELFDLPNEDKAEYMDADPMDPVRIGTGFYSVVDGAKYWRDYVKMFAHPELHCPAKPEKLRDIAQEYSVHTRALLMELTKAISESLGFDSNRIYEATHLDSCFQILVGNLYPPCTHARHGTMGMPAHSDHGLLTLLFQNGVNGLQIKHKDHWLLVKPLPDSFFVIVGDQLEIVSNGRYKGVLHRAVVSSEQTRLSMVSLIGPCLETIVEPMLELAQDGHGLKFRGIKYRDYMEHQQRNKLIEKSSLNLVRVHDETKGVTN